MYRFIRRRDRSRGQSLVEFALILPIFLLILFGLFDMGRAVYYWSTINNASREAARELIVDQTFVMVSVVLEARTVNVPSRRPVFSRIDAIESKGRSSTVWRTIPWKRTSSRRSVSATSPSRRST